MSTDSTTLPTRLRRAFYALRTEGSGVARETAAIAGGVFIGCLPFYGFHLALCWIFGTMFRLNRVKMYFAANISNPFVAPWLILTELQTGAFLRRGEFQALSPSAIREAGLSVVGLDLLLGSLVVGAALAAVAGTATYLTVRSTTGDPTFLELVRRAADRYVGTSMTAWEFARGKLRGDPVYRTTLFGRLIPSGRVLVDIGCGQGLMLALLAEARRAADAGTLPASVAPPPRYERMVGIERRPRVARIAADALKEDAEIVGADAQSEALPSADAILLFDVLHLIPGPAQDAMLARLRAAVTPGGVILVREADAAAGWWFHVVRLANRLKALALGSWRQPFCFRTRAEWLACFAAHGFDAEARIPEDARSPNVLFRLTVH